jgi:hypothetical protein
VSRPHNSRTNIHLGTYSTAQISLQTIVIITRKKKTPCNTLLTYLKGYGNNPQGKFFLFSNDTHRRVGHVLVRHLGGRIVQSTSMANQIVVNNVHPEAQVKITWPRPEHLLNSSNTQDNRARRSDTACRRLYKVCFIKNTSFVAIHSFG